jgi:hypothetical protein
MGYAVFDGVKLLKYGATRLPTGSLKNMSVLGRRYQSIKHLLESFPGLGTCYYEATDWHLGEKRGESVSARMLRENRNRTVARALGRIEALIESACVELGVRAVQITVHEAKRAATGNGNAGKEMVAEHVLNSFPQLKGQSQDTLDAVSVMIAAQRENPLWRLQIATDSSQDF